MSSLTLAMIALAMIAAMITPDTMLIFHGHERPGNNADLQGHDGPSA